MSCPAQLRIGACLMFCLASVGHVWAQAHSQPPGAGAGQVPGQVPGQGQAQGQGQAGGQGQAQASTDSYRFQQPIPVTIRRTNNAVVQALLVGIDLNNITVMSPQGRTIEYPNSSVRSARSADGSFFYSPSKDKPSEMIARLNQMQPQNTNPGGAGGTGQAGATAGSNVPFTVAGGAGGTGAAAGAGGAAAAAGGHNQAMAGFGQGNTGTANAGAAAASSAQMMAHAQAGTAGAHTPSAIPATAPTPFTTSHSQGSSFQPNTSSSTPPAMPMGAHSSTMPGTSPSSSGMNSPMMPQQQTMGWEYECSKCHHRFTSSVEIKAGHKCVKCGVVWGQVRDENGRVTSSSPAARAGGAVGLIVVVVGIIAAIVRKSQAA